AAEFQVCTDGPNCLFGGSDNGSGDLNTPTGIAVDQATGVVYVVDLNKRISAYSATGTFEGAFGWGVLNGAAAFQFCTATCRSGVGNQFNAGQIGNANFGGMTVSAGLLYFADGGGKRVDVFQPTIAGGVVTGASFNRAFGWDVVSSGPDNTGTAFEICNIAVNPTDVCKQGTTGTGLGQFSSVSNQSGPRDVAVDSAGNIYALDASVGSNAGNGRIQEFSPSSTPITATFGAAALTSVFGSGHKDALSMDTNDHLFVAGNRAGSGSQLAVAELDNTGTLVDTHGTDVTPTDVTFGVGIEPASLGGNLYLATQTTSVLQGLYVLNDAVPTMDPVTTFTGTTATFSGTVASKTFDTHYHFEYSTDGVNWTPFPSTDVDAGTDS